MAYARSFSRVGLATLLMLFVAASASGFELGARFNIGNLDFARERPSTATTLPGDEYIWGVTVTGNQELGNGLGIDLSYTDDPTLRHIGYTRVRYSDQFFSITVGPFFGLFNSPSSILQSGLTTSVSLFLPGVARLTLRTDTSLGARLSVEGDYIQELSEISVGFFLPNVLPTLSLTTKRFTERTAAGEQIDLFTQYALETDIFQKNVPYRVVLLFAFQNNSRQFIEETTSIHSYGSIVLGLETTVELFRAVNLIADLDSSVYTFGREALLGQTNSSTFLFRLSTGVSLDLDAVR